MLDIVIFFSSSFFLFGFLSLETGYKTGAPLLCLFQTRPVGIHPRRLSSFPIEPVTPHIRPDVGSSPVIAPEIRDVQPSPAHAPVLTSFSTSWPDPLAQFKEKDASRTSSAGAHTGASLSLTDDFAICVLGIIWVHIALTSSSVAHRRGAHVGCLDF